MPGPRARTALEIVILGGILAGALLAERSSLSVLPRPVRPLLLPGLMLYGPILAAIFTDRDFASIGLGLPKAGRAAAELLVFFLVVLPVFLTLAGLLFRFGLGMRWEFQPPSGIPGLVVWQLAGVALPEEFFFRGWLQARLDRLLPARLELWGGKAGAGLVLAALAFALAHFVIRPAGVKLLVFFPGLLFGYFRSRSDSILVPVLAHAGGNVFFLVLQSFFFPA